MWLSLGCARVLILSYGIPPIPGGATYASNVCINSEEFVWMKIVFPVARDVVDEQKCVTYFTVF